MSEKLGMTIEQMENEIVFMRGFHKWCEENLDGYAEAIHVYALNNACEWLESVGMDSAEFRQMMEGEKPKS